MGFPRVPPLKETPICLKAVFWGFLGCLACLKQGPTFLSTEPKNVKKPTPSEGDLLGNFGLVKLNFTHQKVVETFWVVFLDRRFCLETNGCPGTDGWVGGS